MKIEINIPKNDYVQPTEVRENVVQDICKYICDRMNNDKDGLYHTIIREKIGEPMHLYLGYRKDGRVNVLRDHLDEWEKRDPYIKVRTCEMQAVFEAIQEAGYFIFPVYCSNLMEHEYHFSKKPVLNGWKAETRKFNLFID